MSNEQHDKRDVDVTPRLLYTHLSTGDAQYHDIEKMALVEFDITNNSEKSILVSLVSEIEDCSYEKNDPLWLAPGQRLICRQLPRIKDANVHQLDQDRSTQVLTSYIYDGKTYPIKEDLSLTVIPYNEIIWLMPHPTEAGSRISLFHHIVAWVYDDGDKDVREMQDNVLAELEREKKSPGYPQYLNEYDEGNKPRELVRTIFRLLRDSKKISYRYRNDSEGTPRGENEISQSVKRPGKTLRDEKGNCIDIAVLCANLIKTIGLDPIIVIKKNHAFVGWKSYSEDVWNLLYPDEKLDRQEYEFLDTTWSLLQNKDFEEACKAGQNLYDEILANNWLAERPFNPRGFARILDIKTDHKKLEQAKTTAKFFKVVPPPEASSPQNDESLALPENITRLPAPEIVSNTAQQNHRIASYDYITRTENSLRRIKSRISGSMSVKDCGFAGSLLRLIQHPVLPEVENIFSEERQWTDRLEALWSDIYRLTITIHDLQSAQAANSRKIAPLQPSEVQRSLAGPDIPALYENLLDRTEEIARDLEAAMMPEETGTKYDAMAIEQREETGTKHDVIALKQREETEINETPSPPETSGAIEVFYSNAQEDEHLAVKLRKHLALLERENLITNWYAGKIVAGQELSKQIREHLNSARIILLFISSVYLSSDDYNVEVKRAMERSKAEEAIVMPILLSATDDLSNTPFGGLQTFPRNHRPINQWHDKNEALAEIAREIRTAVTGLNHKAETG